MPFDALAFSGCGTLNFYQTGVSSALQRRGLSPELLFAGSSAGSGLSALLAGGVDAREILSVASELLHPHRGKNLLFSPLVLQDFADRFLETFVDDALHEAIGKRVHISITRIKPWGNLLVNQFTSAEDLRQAIRASCHIPSVRYPSVMFRGQRCIDGGFSVNNPSVGQRCLRVSPFFFDLRMKIRPRRFTPPWWTVIAPSAGRAQRLFSQGAQDGERYLKSVEGAFMTSGEPEIETRL